MGRHQQCSWFRCQFPENGISCFGLDVEKELCTNRNNGLSLKERKKDKENERKSLWVTTFCWKSFCRTLNLCSYSWTKSQRLPATVSCHRMICTHKLCQLFSLLGHCPLSAFISLHLSMFLSAFHSILRNVMCHLMYKSPEFIDFLIKLCHFSP